MASERVDPTRPEGTSTVKPAAALRHSPWLYAGILLIVVVGGIAFSLLLQTVSMSCISNPAAPALSIIPSCGSLLGLEVAAGLVGVAALVLGVLLLRQANVTPRRRVPLAAGILVALVIVVAGIPLALTPPLGTIGIPDSLPFPIPAGTTFNATPTWGSAFTQAQIHLDPYSPYAPIYIFGAYNASSTVCVYITRSAGPDLGPGGDSVCGTNVSFAFGVTASTWMIAFELPQTTPQTVLSATVVITESVEVGY